jgi:hypothetical protein
MSINNFELLAPFISVKTHIENPFYLLQILKRRKDNPTMDKDMEVIDQMCIYNKSDLEKKMAHIMAICVRNNARAYINLNVRDLERVGLQALKLTVDYIISHNYKAVKKAFWAAAGTCNSEIFKKWVVDVDITAPYYVDQIIASIKELHKQAKRGDDGIFGVVPTKKGFHIICAPFNVQEARKIFEEDIQKDNGTILYVP